MKKPIPDKAALKVLPVLMLCLASAAASAGKPAVEPTAAGSPSARPAKHKAAEYRKNDRVNVRVECGTEEKSPVKIIEAEVVSVDENGRPNVDIEDVRKKAGAGCRIGNHLQIERTAEQKQADRKKQYKDMAKKGGALSVLLAESAGNTKLSRTLSGILGLGSLIDPDAEEGDYKAAIGALGGAAAGGDMTIRAMAGYFDAKGRDEAYAHAAVIDREQERKLAEAAAQSKETDVLAKKKMSREDQAALFAGQSRGLTTGSTFDRAKASVKWPAAAKVYDPMLVRAANEYGVDPDILRAMALVESQFNPNAVSHVGARGLIQLMPGTARDMGFSPSAMFDPMSNLRAAAKYVRHLQSKGYIGKNNIALLAAAYNAGPGRVAQYRGIPPYKETVGHVKKVSAAYYSLKADKSV